MNYVEKITAITNDEENRDKLMKIADYFGVSIEYFLM